MGSDERGDHPTEDNRRGPDGEALTGSDGELRVQRSEEEASAGTRERAAGSMKVRKSVRTEHEQVRVPKRREEVGIERTPVNREAPDAEISETDEEIVVQVFEEEVVVTKRVVLREEIRIRKKVVEEEEVVDVDLRKEEVEIDDQTERGDERETGSMEPHGRNS